MKKKTIKYLYWAPRIISILFIFFLMLMSLDVFSPALSTKEIAIGLFMHNLPALFLLAVLLVSWKYEIVGGIAFILAGFLYIGIMITNAIQNTFQGYMISYSFIVAGPAFLIGILFLTNWFGKHKKHTSGTVL